MSNKALEAYYTYIGVDVSKQHLDINRGGKASQITNDEKAVAAFVVSLKRSSASAGTPPPLVVLEASGSYERILTRALAKANIAFRLVNPRQVRDYAKSTGQLAKTDKIDAAVLVDFGLANGLKPRPDAPSSVKALRSLEHARAALVEDRKRWSNRLGQDLGDGIKHEATLMIRHLDKRITMVEKKIRQHVATDERLNTRLNILIEVKGIGRTTACTLMACMPELGSLNRRSAANLAGLAPHACDSGTLRGQRRCWGGRKQVRTALYMPTLTALRCNDVIRPIYLQLVNAGKPKKVAVTAVMRHLITHLNAILKDHQHHCYANPQT